MIVIYILFRLAPGKSLFYYSPGVTNCEPENKKYCLCLEENDKVFVKCDAERIQRNTGGKSLVPGLLFIIVTLTFS